MTDNFTKYHVGNDDIFTLAFLSYFIGLVISRIGSVVVEPIFRKVKIVKFSDYSEFIEASKHDEKIEILSEQNNVFRTLISLFFIVFIVKIYEKFSEYCNLWEFDFYILTLTLLIIFVLAYRKQTNYITSRINKALNK